MNMPDGFEHQPGLISEEEEKRLVAEAAQLPFKPFEFRGYVGNRRVVSFGWLYDFNDSKLKKADEMPQFLLPVRDAAAHFARIPPSSIQHALITEYSTGAAIGWHLDRNIFDDVIGISLNAACTLRFRRKDGQKWDRASMTLEPRSAYILRGPARTEWQHSIPAVDSLRYSITFRTMKTGRV
jgi:alkylated DNA repair dioxygenase AlkB